MSQFKQLLKLLQHEFSYQEKLLDLLTKERVAIVKLNQDQLDQLTEKKDELLAEAGSVEKRRREVLEALLPEDTEPKLATVVAKCPPSEGRKDLERIGKELKELATQVRDLNDQNGLLIRQSLGLIASTVSIMTSSPESDLPTYSAKGSLSSGGQQDPAFAPRRQLTREA